MSERRTVALVTLGCARNEVDSEELAGRLAADGWDLPETGTDNTTATNIAAHNEEIGQGGNNGNANREPEHTWESLANPWQSDPRP